MVEGLALLFPGQASQHVSMCSDLWDFCAESQQLLRQAEDLSGLPLRHLCEHGPLAQLTETVVAQPAVVACSLAAWLALREIARSEGVDGFPTAVAGHSVGELSAAVAAGAVEPGLALELVIQRARLMEQACGECDGTMAAVIGLEASQVEAVCRDASATGTGMVEVANLNAPDQVVITGERRALEEAGRLARSAGAWVVPLQVSGPFHSSYMATAAERFASFLQGVQFDNPTCWLVANVDGHEVRSGAELRAKLGQQIRSQVRWTDCLCRLRELGCTTFVEVGPGRTLAGLARRTLGEVATLAINDVQTLRSSLDVLRKLAAA